MAIDLTTATFDNEVQEGAVLVQFHAEWCVSCKMISPRLVELEDEGHFKLVRVDVDAESELAARFRIMSLPTLILFKNGQSVRTVIGTKSKRELLEEFADFL